MNEEKQHLYHVAYHYNQANGNSFGSGTIVFHKEITSSSDVKKIENLIKEKHQFDNVVIINWVKLESL